jgi:DNA-directed RNA polymerase subunit RPC12/RpoP
MWFCANCRNEMDDKYRHCWQCGTKRVVGTRPPRNPAEITAVPQFASYEEMAKVPKQQPFIFRLFLQPNLLRRPLILLVMVGLLKFFGSPFLGKYGLYIVIVVGVVGLIVILWGHFRRDPTEGVGVKLN